MTYAALVTLVLAVAPAQAAAPVASLESGFGQAAKLVRPASGPALRAAALTAGPLENLAWDVQRAESDATRLRRDVTWLRIRASRYDRDHGRERDPMLRWDIQRFLQDAGDLARGARLRVDEVRRLSGQAQKDEALVFPAQRLSDAATRLSETSRQLSFEARLAVFDFMRAGFAFEGMELSRLGADVETQTRDLADEARRLLEKIRG